MYISEREVHEVLKSLGVPSDKRGFSYLRDAIFMASDKPELIYNGIRKNIYSKVAEYRKVKLYTVEYHISIAIDKAWNADSEEAETLHVLFGNTISYKKGRPTNTEFIALVVDLLLHKK